MVVMYTVYTVFIYYSSIYKCFAFHCPTFLFHHGKRSCRTNDHFDLLLFMAYIINVKKQTQNTVRSHARLIKEMSIIIAGSCTIH